MSSTLALEALLELPQELLSTIFLFIPSIMELGRIAFVCKKFRMILLSDLGIWKHHCKLFWRCKDFDKKVDLEVIVKHAQDSASWPWFARCFSTEKKSDEETLAFAWHFMDELLTLGNYFKKKKDCNFEKDDSRMAKWRDLQLKCFLPQKLFILGNAYMEEDKEKEGEKFIFYFDFFTLEFTGSMLEIAMKEIG